MPFPPQYARARTKDIIASGEDVRARVRSLTLQLLDEGLDLKQVKNVVTEIMDGTAEAVKSSIPASQSNHLRQVYEGLSEALDATARAAGGAGKELHARGQTFKDKDLAKAASNLKDLEEGFFSTIGGVAEKFSGQVRAELTTLVDETRRAGEKIRPHVTDALKAADGNMLSVATDAAASAGKVARKAAVAALSGAGGLLQGLSDKVSGAKKASSKTAKKTTSKPAAKKASKPAPKKSSKKASPKPAAKKPAAKPTKKAPTKKPAAKKAAKKKGKR
jgi:hypothetical protein